MVTWDVTATDVGVEIKKVSQTGYYDVFNIFYPKEITLASVHHKMHVEVANVGAGAGGGFTNAQELQVMTYNKAINGPDSEQWKVEFDSEYRQMLNNKVFKTVRIDDLPPGMKVIDSVWAMKKKSTGVLCGRINARGFKQVEGQHYDGTTISSPVMNAATIRIVLVLMVMANMIAHIVDVKGAFLHGDFKDGEKVYMKIPRGSRSIFQKLA